MCLLYLALLQNFTDDDDDDDDCVMSGVRWLTAAAAEKEKTPGLEEMEQRILAELMEVVQQRDALVALLEEDRLKSVSTLSSALAHLHLDSGPPFFHVSRSLASVFTPVDVTPISLMRIFIKCCPPGLCRSSLSIRLPADSSTQFMATLAALFSSEHGVCPASFSLLVLTLLDKQSNCDLRSTSSLVTWSRQGIPIT